MFDAINGMMLDMLAVIARKDYERRRRQLQGIAKAKADGIYNGHPQDIERNANIANLLASGLDGHTVRYGL
jgi:DNA invertase Pin-like site-specific DNA recombinase